MSILSATKLIVLCTFVVYSSCSENPWITFISPRQMKNINESAVLNCTVNDPDICGLLWTKTERGRPREVLSMYGQMTTGDPRFQLTICNKKTSYLLHIAEIQATDTATYQCEIIASSRTMIISDVEVLVRSPPYRTTISVTSRNLTSKWFDASVISVTVASGHTVELKCLAEGYPRPTISWIREYDDDDSFNGNILKIKSAVKEDRGTYYCVAENEFGKEKRNIYIEVEFAPVISTPTPKIGQAIYYDIELECHVIAFPAPAVSWYIDGRQLNNNDEYEISNMAAADELTYSVLHVKSIEINQYGDYYCKASNKVGHSEVRINLFKSPTFVNPWRASCRDKKLC